ncbi:site-specific integrase [Mucilaginibacter lappiensis]|uniref:Site-specific recombinase XerD n=1 Tax=Mucilaginibacter lappiensis TaxID=354630 RepID=A0A841J8E1_9SPHI|nr:site-specific integrase [Mucilaginibacter lappiensis]MBB6127449.1 site-specific recombinase XerD [Mucilaginibacter lappiensis]
MLEKSFGLLFFLKQSGNEPKKYIYLRITVDGHPVELSTKKQWWESRWDQEKGRASGVKQDAHEVNYFLDTLENKVFKARKKLIEDEELITAEQLRDMVMGKYQRKMIMEVFADHNRQMEALVGKDFAEGTLERYQTSYDHTKAFLQWQYQVDDFSIRKLDYFFIEQYAFWLKTVRCCNHNTTMKYLANFKKIVLICVKNKWLPADPFIDFKLTKKPVFREPLTEWELEAIISKDFGNERLNNVRDLFLFSCATGLAYADVKKLKRSEIIKGVDGELWIYTPRQKTETPCPIPLLPLALQILDKYAGHPKCINQDRALPILSNQKMNAYLKEIADLCGINKVLTFHLARHTFATTITLNNGVPIETVSKMLGHTTLTQTLHYAKVSHGKIGRDMAALREKYTAPASEVELDDSTILLKPVKLPLNLPKYNYVLVAS